MKLLKAFKKPAERVPEDEQLVVQFQEWLVSDERFKADPWRNQGMRFYPSGFGYNCDRSMALKFCKAPISTADRDPKREITFRLGDGIHGELQKLFAKFCKQRGWEFAEEVRIKPDENKWFISGRDDIEIYQSINDKKIGVEIKSINDRDFQALHKSPKREHLEQGNIYVGLRKLDRMHYLYVNKDKSTFKEFVRPFDEGLFCESISRLERILLEMQNNRFPTCAKCTSQCEFYGINQRRPDLTVEDIADAPTAKAIKDFKPTYVRARRKAR